MIPNTSDYENKMEKLLGDAYTYQKLDKDPTPAYERECVGILLHRY